MHAAVACAVAALLTYVLTPLAIRVAVRTKFYDLPAGYKGHRSPTPYLGGTAIVLGIVFGAIVTGGLPQRYLPIVICALAIWAMGTVDDKVSLPIAVRVLIEIGVGVTLAATGLGWNVFHQDVPDGILSVVWVVGVMNAFNLMDNMDGASATTAAISSLGAGTLALLAGRPGLAPLCFATAGACAGFLPRNLANPARVFMGDGGSLPLGMIVASVAMSAVTRDYLGARGVVIAALLVGLVIFDTTLVTVSRSRAGRSILTGGRDHTTHRLGQWLGSPLNVAVTLATTQLVLCGVTILVAQAGKGWILLAGVVAFIFGVALIWRFETSPLFKPAPIAELGQRQASAAADHGSEVAAVG